MKPYCANPARSNGSEVAVFLGVCFLTDAVIHSPHPSTPTPFPLPPSPSAYPLPLWMDQRRKQWQQRKRKAGERVVAKGRNSCQQSIDVLLVKFISGLQKAVIIKTWRRDFPGL